VEATLKELLHYVDSGGSEPFQDWLDGLTAKIRGIIRNRLDRVENGNLGNSHGVGEAVRELVIDVGPGYRVYFGQDGNKVILLNGGTKKTQRGDIKRAKEFWSDHNA